jgi:sensor histidine kinase YesM
VHDNGVGIDRERLCRMRARLRSNQSSDENGPGESGLHIGLKNVDARLRLVFGASCRIRIFSIAGVGTTIAFQIPLPEGAGGVR